MGTRTRLRGKTARAPMFNTCTKTDLVDEMRRLGLTLVMERRCAGAWNEHRALVAVDVAGTATEFSTVMNGVAVDWKDELQMLAAKFEGVRLWP